MKLGAFFALYLLALSAHAVELQFAGTVGNSGSDGMWLVRSTAGRWSGGVVVDQRGRIFTSGGDRIVTLNRDGKLLWQSLLPEKDWVIGGATFATGGKYLYFIAGKPLAFQGGYCVLTSPFIMTEPNLCRVEMAPGAMAEIIAKRDWFHCEGWPPPEIALTATKDGNSVYLGYTTSRTGAGTYSVFEIRADGSLSPLFTKATRGGRVSVDEAGDFYMRVDGQIQKLNARGEPVSSFAPVAVPSLGAVASSLEGTVMLTRDALWDMGHYGFVARFTRAMKPWPGVVVQWQHMLGWVAQIADAPDDAYYIKSTGGLYVARLEDEKLKLTRRFGSLPEAHCLVLTGNGYIGIDGPSFAGMLWFDFDNDRADAVPVRGEFPSPATQGFAQGNSVLAYNVAPNHLPHEYQPRPKGIELLTYEPEPFVGGSLHGPGGEFDGQLTAVTRAGNFYFAIDAQHQRLARAPADKPCNLVLVEMEPAPMNAVAALSRDELVVSGGGSIRAFQVDATGNLKPLWQMKDFGDEVYVAISGMQMLVADTRRHRVVLFGFDTKLDQPPTWQAQFGETDQPGTDVSHLDSPTLVSIHGSRAIVYDAGNQRVVKLRIR